MTDGRISQLGVNTGGYTRAELAGFFFELLATADTAMSPLGTNYAVGLDTIVNETNYLVPCKPIAQTATTAALPACSYDNGTSGVGATLTKSSNGAIAAIDGYTPVVGDLILVKNQASAVQNGLYRVTDEGSGGAPWILTRHASFDSTDNIPGAFITVSNRCSTNQKSLWLCSAVPPITVGSGNLNFDQVNGLAQVTAGAGISISGNTISTRPYTALIGDGSTTAIAVTQGAHGLSANGKLIAACYDASTGAQVYPDVSIDNSNGTVTFTFAVAPTTNQFRIVIFG